ncbi:hypothetical protein [Pedobacter soli]|uniref:DUF4296 domain-containing protein n=1 Tax=Pedobacter soli TaxID=390242 RepID=A0A1G6UFK6_9SPHI|nr:hypothetical protein [Pedobacter soli]SDD40031.1 hypothetical protein SAMN04488024_105330 [Pedobacter soli]
MKNWVKSGKLIILLSCILVGSLQSCKKNLEKVEEIKSEVTKIERLEVYISKVWNIPVDKIKYDAVKEIFVFKDFEINRDEIDTLYSRAAEYHLKIGK